VCVYERERWREGGRGVSVLCERERKRECLCCVREKEKGRVRGRGSVCV